MNTKNEEASIKVKVFHIPVYTLIQEINSRFEAINSINDILLLFGNLTVTVKVKLKGKVNVIPKTLTQMTTEEINI